MDDPRQARGGAPSLHLIIPGLLRRVPEWAVGLAPFPELPRLRRLLARGRRAGAPARGYDALLCALAGLKPPPGTDLPLGALIRHGLAADPDPGHCLAADPVHLDADLHRLVLWGPDRLALDEAEAQAFEALFNDHFRGLGVVLEAASTSHWQLRVPGHRAVQTTPLREVMGANIDRHLPRGGDAGFWRSLLNEVQMLFHEAAPNRERSARGRPALNSLWFYGAGTLPEPLPPVWARVWADDPLALGLARRAGVPAGPPPAGLDGLLAGAGGGVHLVCLHDLAAAGAYDDFTLWARRVQALESAWFGPLLEALRGGRLGRCDLHDGEGRAFRIPGRWRWGTWRRPGSLQSYAL